MANGRPVILRSIIKMAHELGMEVVAEGAETESEAIELYQLGCEYAQGPCSAIRCRCCRPASWSAPRRARRASGEPGDDGMSAAEYAYACPASIDSIAGSMPILRSASS